MTGSAVEMTRQRERMPDGDWVECGGLLSWRGGCVSAGPRVLCVCMARGTERQISVQSNEGFPDGMSGPLPLGVQGGWITWKLGFLLILQF